MLEQLEGSQAVAEAVALCRPEVICAYPISPQTHIVEHCGLLVRQGKVGRCEYINVESEFAALSVAIGASASGARCYTATASQGLLYMAEAVYNAAGLGLPIVMTVANRAIGSPINIWNDHTDSMAMRDAGWIQLYAETNQEALDLHIQAFKIAEWLSCPVMVCMDGFILTHTMEPIDLPTHEAVRAWLPPLEFSRRLDPAAPKSMGMLVTPDYFPEVRHSHHSAMRKALDVIEDTDADFRKAFGRAAGGLLTVEGDADAKIGVIAMGSTVGTMRAGMADFADEVGPARLIALRSFRPFPARALREAVDGLDHLIVIDRAISPGLGGILGVEVSAVLAGIAGALYVPQVGIINPGEFAPLKSIELVIWVAVGGRATLYGAVVGAVLVNSWSSDSRHVAATACAW